MLSSDTMATYLLAQVKDDMAYMLNTESDWVTSEGMSYGIMIAAQVGPNPPFFTMFSNYFNGCVLFTFGSTEWPPVSPPSSRCPLTNTPSPWRHAVMYSLIHSYDTQTLQSAHCAAVWCCADGQAHRARPPVEVDQDVHAQQGRRPQG